MNDQYQSIEAKMLHEVRKKINPLAYQHSLFKILSWCAIDLLFFALSFMGIVFAHSFFLKIILSLLMGIAISSLFVLAHDAAHGALFKRNWVAKIIGTLFMLPALNVYDLWCWGHNRIHHGFTSLSSVDWIWRPLSREEYQTLSPIHRFFYRAERSLYGCGFHYLIKVWLSKMILFLPRQLSLKKKLQLTLGKIWVFLYAVLISLFAYRLDGVFGIFTMLILPFIVFNYVISLIIYLHHTHPDIPFFDEKAEWNHAVGALYCTTVIHTNWLINSFTHHILIHTPHHIDIRIPFYRLKLAFKDIKKHYVTYLHEYHLNWNGLTHIFKSCKLYDYQSHSWHSFQPRKNS